MLWVWYNLLAVVSLISLTSWISSSLSFEQRKKFIIRRLELADVDFKKAMFDQELNEFVRDYIKMDGVFVLKMLTIHSGILVCSEVVDAMWDNYLIEIGKLPSSKDKNFLSVDDQFHEHSSISMSKRKVRALVPLVPQEYVEMPPSQHNNGSNTVKPKSRNPSFRSQSAQK
uniref:Innexin n=1 Tax=Acrobeloides nanus TaxID=290746 RepID=A0A914DDS0_9BILA